MGYYEGPKHACSHSFKGMNQWHILDNLLRFIWKPIDHKKTTRYWKDKIVYSGQEFLHDFVGLDRPAYRNAIPWPYRPSLSTEQNRSKTIHWPNKLKEKEKKINHCSRRRC